MAIAFAAPRSNVIATAALALFALLIPAAARAPQADLSEASRHLAATDARSRPVTFLFNGGPGAASASVQFGEAAPWRLSFRWDAASSSASPELTPNAETWMDFTDLVFLDP